MCLNSLYPDTPYATESGGDPQFIPDLSYEQFVNFHRTLYHPANSYIFVYGNCDMEERLEYFDREYLGIMMRLQLIRRFRTRSRLTGQKGLRECTP